MAYPPSNPATNDIPTDALGNSQQLPQTGHITHELMSFIHHCSCEGTGAGEVHPRTGSECLEQE